MTDTFLNDNSGKSATVKREILRLCIAHNNYSIAVVSRAARRIAPIVN